MGSAPKLYESDTDLAEMASEYLRIKEEVKALNDTLEIYREALLSAVENEPTGVIREGDIEIKMTSKTRRGFDLKTAEKVLAIEVLSPFYTVSTFDELKVKRLGLP